MKRSVCSFFDLENAPLIVQPIALPELKDHQVSLDVVRDDLFHPMIAGNKWWKLKHALIHAEKEGIPRLVTFGGAYSNHILAVAAAGHLFGFETVGIIRGEESRKLNPVLSQARHWGMRLEGISRESYRQKNNSDYLEQLKLDWSPCLILPEGGSSSFAVQGTCEMTARLQGQYDHFCCSVGTGGTMAGMVLGATSNTEVQGFSALKNGDFLVSEIHRLLKGYEVSDRHWSIQTEFHMGGYARSNAALRSFCEHFQASQKLDLDLVYTGKMFFGILELVRRGFYKKGAKIAAWHTGNAHGEACARSGRYSLEKI